MTGSWSMARWGVIRRLAGKEHQEAFGVLKIVYVSWLTQTKHSALEDDDCLDVHPLTFPPKTIQNKENHNLSTTQRQRIPKLQNKYKLKKKKNPREGSFVFQQSVPHLFTPCLPPQLAPTSCDSRPMAKETKKYCCKEARELVAVLGIKDEIFYE